MRVRSWVAGIGLAIGLSNVAHADDRQVVFVDEAGNPIASSHTIATAPTSTVTTTTVPSTTVTTTTSAATTVTTTSTVVTQSVPVYTSPVYTPYTQPVYTQPQPIAPPPRLAKQTWFGFSLGAVATPFATPSYLKANDKLGTNHFKACLAPGDKRYCSSLRGFDARVQIFNARDIWDYPRWIGYFRTGYRAGRADFDPHGGGSYQDGEASSLTYASVPIFFGGSVYAFKHFPVRPFAGLGVGVDVTKLNYKVHGQADVQQTSVRPGLEIHGGLEARITNYVAVTFEVQQLWSMRRRVQNLPAMSNSALTLMAGISVSLPSPGTRGGWLR
jgi:hypothetical protein